MLRLLGRRSGIARSGPSVGCAAGTVRAAGLHRRAVSSAAAFNAAAAFPTAQLVAAHRAMDAKSENPRIGSNIGAGPDLAAASLAGPLGFEFMDDMAMLFVEYEGNRHRDELSEPQKERLRHRASQGLADRSMFYDDRWMRAAENGCTQFVILAAGLDARAWRLPLDASHTIFEVDCPEGLHYKEEKVRELELPLRCGRRVTVEADLSDGTWPADLIAAGFCPDKQSFFLIEGLLMYLPPDAPPAFMRHVASLMAPGSSVHGCSFVRLISTYEEYGVGDVLSKYGTQWTYETETDTALAELMESAGLLEPAIVPVSEAAASLRVPALAGETPEQHELRVKAETMFHVLWNFTVWPGPVLDIIVPGIVKNGEEGVAKFVANIVDDKQGRHGLKHLSSEDKAWIVKTMLHEIDGGSLPRHMIEECELVVEERQHISGWTKFVGAAKFMYKMWREGSVGEGGAPGYKIFSATR